MQRQRLVRELEKMSRDPPSGISLTSKDDSSNVLEAIILGPNETPYRNGIFQLEILISDKYPFSPPSVRFLTKVYHPNIDENGRICMDLLKMPPTGSWRPNISLESLLIAVRMLLGSPNLEDPLMSDIADEFKHNIEEFRRKATLFVVKYATDL